MTAWQTRIVAAMFAGCTSAAALAQETQGALLDAGAVKLSKQQVIETISGATLKGPMPGGGTKEITYRADGTYSGSYLGRPGTRGVAKEGGVFGKWNVEQGGKLCEEGHGGGGKETARCTFFYRAGDQLYEVHGPAGNRSAVALKRSATR